VQFIYEDSHYKLLKFKNFIGIGFGKIAILFALGAYQQKEAAMILLGLFFYPDDGSNMLLRKKS
jgi:hypothetical protein